MYIITVDTKYYPYVLKFHRKENAIKRFKELKKEIEEAEKHNLKDVEDLWPDSNSENAIFLSEIPDENKYIGEDYYEPEFEDEE